MLREEAEKLFTSLEKIIVDETIDEHISKTSSAVVSLPILPLDDEQQQKSSTSWYKQQRLAFDSSATILLYNRLRW
jgi:hypothetical protein